MATRPKSLSATKNHQHDLDIGQVRALFDRLSIAVANPRRAATADAAQRLQVCTPVLDGLRDVVDAVHRRDPLVSHQPIARDPRLAPAIKQLTSELRGTYLAWLGASLDSRKMSVARSLLSHSVPDLLDVLGKTAEENAHSDVIRWLLDPREAKVVAPAALRALVKRLPRETDEWQRLISIAVQQHTLSVRREYAIPTEEADEKGQGRIDLLISGPGFGLVIENKVGSDEHDNQTDLYWQWLYEQKELRLKGAMFLTPVGFPAQNRNFKPLSYLDLLSCLLEGPAQVRVEGVEEAVLASYVKTLAAGILQQELHVIVQSGGQP